MYSSIESALRPGSKPGCHVFKKRKFLRGKHVMAFNARAMRRLYEQIPDEEIEVEQPTFGVTPSKRHFACSPSI